MKNILLTNDDSYRSIGLMPLLKELKKKFSVFTVTPDTDKSWIGKSITARTELELKNINYEGENMYTLSGTPADCVQVGLYDVVHQKVDLVVSGINVGSNAGHGRILSSGTVGAAMEASIDGIKAISISLKVPLSFKKENDIFAPENFHYFENAARISVKLIKIFMNHDFGEDTDLISINIPFEATVNSEVEVTKPFRDPYGKLFYKNGDKFKHINPPLEYKNLKEQTDLKALSEGKISVTPLCLELAARDIKSLRYLLKSEWN